jgi:hypothetical protein
MDRRVIPTGKLTSIIPKGLLLVSSTFQKNFYLFLADGSTADATHATKPILPEFAGIGALTAGLSKLISTQQTVQNVGQNISPLVRLQVGKQNGCGVGSQKNKVFRPPPPIL